MRPLLVWSVWMALLIFGTSIYTQSLAARAVTTEARLEPEQKPKARGTDVSRIPFELSGNHIFVHTRLNGTHLLWFLLDSGASFSIINIERARTLGLGLEGESQVSAVGGSVSGATVSNVSLGFGEVNLENQTLAALPLGGVERLAGRAIDGLLGGDFFARFVVDIDYEAKIITLYEPQSYKYSGNGESIPILLNEMTPFVHAKIVTPGGTVFDGTFEVDTGVQLASPFVQAHNLLNGNQHSIPGPGAVEAGGQTSQRIGRLDRLEIGRVSMSKPIASFSQDAEGELAHAEYSGVIGAEFLRRFRVILDYSRQRMILEPNRHMADPDEYDMSGMDLIAEGPDFKTFKVRETLADSPAAERGVRKGDVIVAVDGRRASALSLNQIEQMFRQHNRPYQLRIRRDENLLRRAIRLRRLI